MKAGYRLFAERYGWDVNQVAHMTHEQKLMYLEEGAPFDQKIVPFDTLEQAAEFQKRRRANV